MSSNNNKQEKLQFKTAERVYDGLLYLIKAFSMVCFNGLKQINYKSGVTWYFIYSHVFCSVVIAHQNYFNRVFYHFFNGEIGTRIALRLEDVSRWWQGMWIFVAFCVVNLFFLGFTSYFRNRKYQRALDELNLKSGKGTKPLSLIHI